MMTFVRVHVVKIRVPMTMSARGMKTMTIGYTIRNIYSNSRIIHRNYRPPIYRNRRTFSKVAKPIWNILSKTMCLATRRIQEKKEKKKEISKQQSYPQMGNSICTICGHKKTAIHATAGIIATTAIKTTATIPIAANSTTAGHTISMTNRNSGPYRMAN